MALLGVHIDHVFDAFQTSWTVVGGRGVPPVSGPGVGRTGVLQEPRLLEAMSRRGARRRLSVAHVSPLHLHVCWGFIVDGVV